jgi:lipopolysaccharide exporter
MSAAPVVTQIISFLLMPIISRVYSPAVFGIFNLYGSLVGPISALSTFGYHQAIILPEKNTTAKMLTYGCLIFSLLVSTLTFTIILSLPDKFWVKYSLESVKPYSWLIPFSIFFHGIHTTLTSLNQRNTKFGTIAVARITNALSNKIFIIIIAFLGYKSSGSLIVGSLIGALSMIIILGIPNRKLFTWVIPFSMKPFIKYKKFPKYILSTDFLYRVKNAIIIYLLAYYFGENIVGIYGMAIMMAGLPTVLVASAVGEVFYQKAAKEYGEENNTEIYEKLFSFLIKFALLPYALLAIVAPEVFSILLGEKWGTAGIFVQLLSFQMFITFIMTPIISLSKIYNKQEYTFINQIFIFITSCGAIAYGGFIGNVYWAIFIMSFFTGFINIIFGIKILKVADFPLIKCLKISIKTVVYCIPFISIFFVLKIMIISNIIILLISGVIIITIYYYYFFNEHFVILLSSFKSIKDKI